MFKVQFKSKSPYGPWVSAGSFGSESVAIAAALNKKKLGAILIRVVNKKNQVIFSQ